MWLNTEKISLTMILFFLQLLFNCYFRLPVCASVLRHELCVNEFLLLRIFSFVVVNFFIFIFIHHNRQHRTKNRRKKLNYLSRT